MTDYKEVALNQKEFILRKFNTFTSRLHVMYVEMKNKVALSHFDNKRYITRNNIDTLAWGNRKIKELEGEGSNSI